MIWRSKLSDGPAGKDVAKAGCFGSCQADRAETDQRNGYGKVPWNGKRSGNVSEKAFGIKEIIEE